MKYEIAYTENKHIWKIEDIANSHGYTKTQECYWVQIFEDGNGNSIVCTRDDGELFSDPCARLEAMLDGVAADETTKETTQEATEEAQEDKNENREYCKRIAQELETIAAGEVTNDDGEEMSLYDYLSDVLDYEYTIDSQRNYKSSKIWVTLGGPNVWIDTAEKAVKLAWGTDREEYPIGWDVCDEIDAIMAEYWEMV